MHRLFEVSSIKMATKLVREQGLVDIEIKGLLRWHPVFLVIRASLA